MDRKKLEEIEVLNYSELPLFSRLAFNEENYNSAPDLNINNINVRNKVAYEILSGENHIRKLNDILDTVNPDDLLLAEVDRYGLPHRTVINKNTGLVRTNPYFSEHWLSIFYSKYYRDLYTNFQEHPAITVLLEQATRGSKYYNYISSYLSENDKILEIGCGMGGVLMPFKISGHDIKGIDLGKKFIDLGNQFNLNLELLTIENLLSRSEKYDLIILSHLIEHIPELELFLKKVIQLLNDNGKIFIAVPGLKMINKTYHGNLHIYLQNAHCWSFTQVTLSAFLNRLGFKILLSNEEVLCLAQMTDSLVEADYDLKTEAQSILNYLTLMESNFYKKNKRSFLKSLYKMIKNKLKILS